MTKQTVKSDVPLYRAWVKKDYTPLMSPQATVKAADRVAPMPNEDAILYDNEPNGNLIGLLPMGARPMPSGEGGTFHRTDGGDPFESALFTSPSGRIYVIERSK